MNNNETSNIKGIIDKFIEFLKSLVEIIKGLINK